MMTGSVPETVSAASLVLKLVAAPEARVLVNSRIELHYRRKADDGLSWQAIVASGRYENTNAFFNACQRLPVGAHALPQFVRIEETSYWEFLPSYIWPDFFLATQLVEVVQELFATVRPARIEIMPAEPEIDAIWRGVVLGIARGHSVPATLATRLKSTSDRRRRLIEMLRRKGVAYAVRAAKRRYASLRRGQVPPSTTTGAKKVMFLTNGGRHWVAQPGDASKKHDEQFYPFLAALREQGWSDVIVADVEDLPQDKLDLRSCDQPTRIRWRRLSSYAHTRIVSSVVRWWRGRRLWRSLRTDEAFASAFCYRDVPLMAALSRVLERALSDLVPECADLMDLAANALTQERPRAVLLTYETGPWQRAFIIHCSRRRIPTVGLQHGMIFRNHYDYTHEGKTDDPAVRAAVFSIPRVTCVWGDAWRDTLLEHGHYPTHTVEVTGNWRYDFLTQRDTAGVAAAKPTVIAICLAGDNVATTLQACLNALGGIAGLQLRVRLHPADDEAPVKKVLAGRSLPENVIHRGNLFELLRSTDIVVSQYSTLISEAALADKPIVLLDLDRKFFTSDYEDAGICLAAREPGELRQAVLDLASNPHLRSRLSEARRAFVARYFFRLDGLAAPRVVDVIERLVKDVA